MKEFFKELDYESIMKKAKSNARDLFICSAFIILYAMIAYPDIKHYSIGSIVSILFIIECSIDLILTIFGYRNIYHKHPIFENFVRYIISVAIIPIQISLLKMLLEIPNNPNIVIKIILIWFVVVGLGVIENFARDFGPKNYIISCYDDKTIGSPGTGKRVNIENKK